MNVSRLYTSVLGRTGDAGGIEFWQEQLDEGTWTEMGVLLEFLAVRFAADTEVSRVMNEQLDSLTRPDIKAADVERVAREVFYAELREVANHDS